MEIRVDGTTIPVIGVRSFNGKIGGADRTGVTLVFSRQDVTYDTLRESLTGNIGLYDGAERLNEFNGYEQGRFEIEGAEIAVTICEPMALETLNRQIEEANQLLRVFARSLPDNLALEVSDVYNEWELNRSYSENEIIRDGAALYRVAQDHTSQPGCLPEETPALYRQIS